MSGVLIPFRRFRCTCGHVAGSDEALDVHYDEAHPKFDTPGHPDYPAFQEWLKEWRA